MITFVSRTIVQRTRPGQRQSVQQEDYYCHVHVLDDSKLAAIVVADIEYPSRAAFSIISAVLEQLSRMPEAYSTLPTSNSSTVHIADSLCEQSLLKYQDPLQADKLSKIQRDLDETKIILHKTIEGVLERGEKLDALVARSNDLSLASQMFYKQAKKTNSCCSYM